MNLPERLFADAPTPLLWLGKRVPLLCWPLHFGWRLAMRWGDDQCPLKAAAMAFFGLISIFPIILAAVSILATILSGNAGALDAFQSFVIQFFPGETGSNISHAMESAVTRIAGGTSATTLGFVALASLMWSGRAFFATLTDVLSHVWPDSKPRSFWLNQLVLWSTFLGAGALWLLSTLTTFAVTLAGELLLYLPDMIRNSFPWLDILSRLSSFLLTTLMFWLIYRFLPNVEGPRRKLLVWGSALLAAVFWELAKIIFAKFLGNLNRYEATYGSVAGVVVTLLWIYASSMILLLGAESAGAYEDTCEVFRERELATK